MSRRNRRAAIIGKQIENTTEAYALWRARQDAGEPVRFGMDDEFAQLSWTIGRDHEELRRLASLCRECGEPGHHKRDCPTVECHACKGPGHKASKCPNKATS